MRFMKSSSKGGDELIKTLFICGIVIAWAFAHYKTSDAVETGKKWASTASYILAIPLLFGFPIGTILWRQNDVACSKLKQE